ncbi:hypothetical protein [Shimazuella kribbensis]|uniref:hypothetical protein n=1 Tax=Shimazuella kribbensis TaxID=139808 RepID=UPI0012EB6672|nr:hypothetical protein [Shimazuella kribbensis]
MGTNENSESSSTGSGNSSFTTSTGTTHTYDENGELTSSVTSDGRDITAQIKSE